MIAQFVEDLLHAIGEATVDELRDLFAQGTEGALFPQLVASAAFPILAPRADRVESAEHGSSKRGANGASFSSAPPPAVAEITDPESLLSLGVHSLGVEYGSPGTFLETFRPPPPTARPARPAPISVALLEPPRARRPDGERESPVSGVRAIGTSTVKLSDNETLARVSNSGVVIRRKKRA